MVTKKQKQQMKDYISQQIINTGRYDILGTFNKGIQIAQKSDLVENPQKMFIYTHDMKTPIREYEAHVRQILNSHDFMCNVFYKDGKDFLVRLGSSGKNRDDKSLKNYSQQELNDMIHLRGLEKKVLEKQWGNNCLVYYQPETERLQEALREYNMRDVWLDYSHLDSDTYAGSFAQDKVSDDYKIAQEVTENNTRLGFKGQHRVLSMVPYRP